jgi:hypothetical protein
MSVATVRLDSSRLKVRMLLILWNPRQISRSPWSLLPWPLACRLNASVGSCEQAARTAILGKGLKHGTPRSTSVSSSGILLQRCSYLSSPLTGHFRRETQALHQGSTLSRKCAVSGKEIVPALFRGEEQLSELRRNSRGSRAWDSSAGRRHRRSNVPR